MLMKDEDLDLSYLGKRFISKSQYLTAYRIYLDVAYPDRREENEAAVINENKMFTSIPIEAHNGCKHCPGMKMKILNEFYDAYFYIFIPMDIDDLTRGKCEELAEQIEKQWKDAGLPVERRWVPRKVYDLKLN